MGHCGALLGAMGCYGALWGARRCPSRQDFPLIETEVEASLRKLKGGRPRPRDLLTP